MNPIIAFNVISKQFSKHESGLLKLEFDVNAGAAATGYVQIHDFPTPADLAANRAAPAAGSVPIKSWPTPAGAIDVYKEFKRGELEFTYGCFVCYSTTRATLTIGTVNNKFDSVAAELISADIVGSEANGQGVVVLQPWTEASGATTNKRLVRVTATNLEAQINYLQLHAINSASLVSGTSVPLTVWAIAATGDGGGLDTKLLSFGGVGNNNLGGIDFDLINATGTHRGCTIALSSTANVYTATGGAGMNVYAEYK